MECSCEVKDTSGGVCRSCGHPSRSMGLCLVCNQETPLSLPNCVHCGKPFDAKEGQRKMFSNPASPARCVKCGSAAKNGGGVCEACFVESTKLEGPLASFSVNGVTFSQSPLEKVFREVELEDLLKAILLDSKVKSFFVSPATVKRLVWFLLQPSAPPKPEDYEPPSSPGSTRIPPPPEKEHEPEIASEGVFEEKIKVYCAEILTNADSVDVFDTLMHNGDLLGYFLSFWKSPHVGDDVVFKSYIRLCEFIVLKRFHSFIRSLYVWDFVIPCMVMQLRVPEVRQLIHTMLWNEHLVSSSMPDVLWSHNSVVPLILTRFRSALDNHGDSFEMIMMLEFVGELLRFHGRESYHVVEEIMDIFALVSTEVMNPTLDFQEEFLALFFEFFPPRKNAGSYHDPTTPFAVCDLALSDEESHPRVVEVKYHEKIELFLAGRSFQRMLRQRMSKEVSTRLSLDKWRAMQAVYRLVQMCSPEMDEALIVSGNLQRFLESFFEHAHSSMVHGLVVDMLVYMIQNSSDATICWVLLEFGMLERSLKKFERFYSATENSPGVDYLGHLVRFLSVLDTNTNEVVSDAIASAPDVFPLWEEFRENVLPKVMASYKYEAMPEKVDRGGTLLERLAMAESEDDAIAKNKERQQERSANHEENVEEEIIEEVVEEEEEVVEEVVEEIIEE